MRIIGTLCTAAALVGLATAAGAQTLKQEPAMGQLRPGQAVFVDDGSCPKGKIKKVTGGDHIEVGGRAQVKRQRQCVPK